MRLGVGLVLAWAGAGCAARPRMCTASSECATKLACVAGRCQPQGAAVKPAVDAARRLVVRPADVACVRRGATASGGGLPAVVSLGRDSAMLLLRFRVPLAPTVNVVEAYVVLRRSEAVDDDPEPISLHAARVAEPWDSRSIAWGRQPRVVDGRSPTTLVEPGGPSLVRIDVRDLVRRWPRRDPADQGLAILAADETPTGATFALRAAGVDPGPSSTVDPEPYLELYVR